jgi:hypothetical protein
MSPSEPSASVVPPAEDMAVTPTPLGSETSSGTEELVGEVAADPTPNWSSWLTPQAYTAGTAGSAEADAAAGAAEAVRQHAASNAEAQLARATRHRVLGTQTNVTR